MKLHAIMVTRDEGDIIAQVLKHLLGMVDFLYVYDTGSLDDTWSQVLAFAKHETRLIPFKSEPAIFFTAIKSYPFNHFRNRFTRGDWIIKADSDEFYLEDIRSFIQMKVMWYENVVFKLTQDYRFTSEDAKAWDEQRETLGDRVHPIQQRRKYWVTYSYSEARIYRYRPGMKWTPWCAEPYFRGVIAKNRIPVAHYQDRDPLQIHRRWTIRKFAAAKKGAGIGRRVEWSSMDNWRQRIVNADTPGLFHNDQRIKVSDPRGSWGLRAWPVRLFQVIMLNGFGRLLDATRPSFPKDFQPELYTDEEVAELRRRLESKLT
jgi:Glycosyl transferase family 2